MRKNTLSELISNQDVARPFCPATLGFEPTSDANLNCRSLNKSSSRNHKKCGKYNGLAIFCCLRNDTKYKAGLPWGYSRELYWLNKRSVLKARPDYLAARAISPLVTQLGH